MGSKVLKTCCLIVASGKNYEKLGECAKNSFLAFHSDIDLFYVTDLSLWNVSGGANVSRLSIALQLFEKGYEKIILLGADTITCSRLEEFLEKDNFDILPTLCYPYQYVSPRVCSPDKETHLNADVVCFTSPEAVRKIIELAPLHKEYNEQGALNEVVWKKEYGFAYNIVEHPYQDSKIVYNARAKGNVVAAPGQKPWGQYTKKMFVSDDRLFTFDNKEIRVWHYCEGLGGLDKSTFEKLINNWIFDWFNEDAKKYFKEKCNCGDFFEKKFTID